MKRNPETLALAMDYAAAMESCAAYVAVRNPSVRDPETAYRLLRPIMDAATSGNAQESFFIIALLCRARHNKAYAECRIMPSCGSPVPKHRVLQTDNSA